MNYLSNENGQGLVEYGLVIVVVAILLIGLVAMLGAQLVTTYQYVIDQLASI